jgi:hypothetical protein
LRGLGDVGRSRHNDWGKNAMSDAPWRKMLDCLAGILNSEAPFTLRLAVDVFERAIASAQIETLSEALSFHSSIHRNGKCSYIQINLTYELGTDGFMKWDQHGQTIFVEIDVRTRFPFRWLWEEAIVFDDIKGELRKKAFKQIRDTLLFAECNDAQPLTSSLGNYGCEKAKEMYSEMIPAMIEAGVFPCVQDSDTGE